MGADCYNLYYADLPRTKLLPERGTFLDMVVEKLPTFQDTLVATR